MPLIKEPTSFTKEMKKDSGSSTPEQQIPALHPPKDPKPSGLINTLGTLLPFAPLLYEQFTGQKVPPMTGTLAEMNTALSQLSLSLSQILNNQQQLWNRLEALEKNASSQLTSLGQQFQSLRLTHSRETKSIEYNQPEPKFTED